MRPCANKETKYLIKDMKKVHSQLFLSNLSTYFFPYPIECEHSFGRSASKLGWLLANAFLLFFFSNFPTIFLLDFCLSIKISNDGFLFIFHSPTASISSKSSPSFNCCSETFLFFSYLFLFLFFFLFHWLLWISSCIVFHLFVR